MSKVAPVGILFTYKQYKHFYLGHDYIIIIFIQKYLKLSDYK